MDDQANSTGPSLLSGETNGSSGRCWTGLLVIAVLVIGLLVGLGFLGYRILQRLDAVDQQVGDLSTKADEVATFSQKAMQRAADAETSARAAAMGRERAEAQMAQARHAAEAARQETAEAREAADAARRETASAREAAARAEAEAERIRREAEAEVDRLEEALGKVAETRRTALGLVMNLGSDYLKFEFDKAELQPGDRELLSRIAGIILTSKDYSISVNGHTDDVGTEAYNQKLSERRAQAVRDYLVGAGLPAGIITVTGHGKKLPLVPGKSDEARAKNRRVELGIVNTRILYGRSADATPDY
jgi:outer membrane protein OmpA-like peptidoglycan-associated protein